jgi:predicted nuclease of predicted toxin-antitoxin system
VKLRAMLDEMLSPVIAARLVDRGHDVVAVKAVAGLIGGSDEDLLIEAAAQERIVVTLDLKDFAVIDSSWKPAGRSHAGLIYLCTVTFPLDEGFVGAVVEALAAAAESDRLPVPDGAIFLRRVS